MEMALSTSCTYHSLHSLGVVDIQGVTLVLGPDAHCTVIRGRNELLSGRAEFDIHDSMDVVLEDVDCPVKFARIEYVDVVIF